MFKEYYEKLLQQLSIDFNCTPTELQAKENVITVSKLNEGRRSYNPDKPFLEMVTLGKKTLSLWRTNVCMIFCTALSRMLRGTAFLN